MIPLLCQLSYAATGTLGLKIQACGIDVKPESDVERGSGASSVGLKAIDKPG